MATCKATKNDGTPCRGVAGPDEFCAFHTPEPPPWRCKARCKNGKGPCRALAVADTGYCRVHGGKGIVASRGAGNGNFKHGLYSKHLPTKLAANAELVITDDRLLSLHSDVALTVTRITDLLDKLNNSPLDYIGLISKLREVQGALLAGGDDDVAKAISALGIIITLAEQNRADLAIWREIGEVMELRRKLVQTEQARLEKLGAYMPADQVTMLLGQLFAIIKKVADQDTFITVQREFSKFATLQLQEARGETVDGTVVDQGGST